MYNGWTPTIPQEVRIDNLIEQIPQPYRAQACLKCYGADDNEFERNLTAYVIGRAWEVTPHPVEEAYRLDKIELDAIMEDPSVSPLEKSNALGRYLAENWDSIEEVKF